MSRPVVSNSLWAGTEQNRLDPLGDLDLDPLEIDLEAPAALPEPGGWDRVVEDLGSVPELLPGEVVCGECHLVTPCWCGE